MKKAGVTRQSPSPLVLCLGCVLLCGGGISCVDYYERADLTAQGEAVGRSCVQYRLEQTAELPTAAAEKPIISKVQFFPDVKGGPTFVWSELVGRTKDFTEVRLRCLSYDGSRWREAEGGPTWRSWGYATGELGVAKDGGGDLHMFCQARHQGRESILHAVCRDHAWSPLEVVSKPGWGVTYVLAAADSAGRAHVVYGGYITDEHYTKDWPHGTAAIKCLHQFFDGERWSEPLRTAPLGAFHQEAAQLIAAPDGGLVLLFRMDIIGSGYQPHMLAVSTFDGTEWSRPVVLHEFPLKGGGLAAVRGSGSPAGDVYAFLSRGVEPVYSTGNGRTWTEPRPIRFDGLLHQFACDSRGRLICLVQAGRAWSVVVKDASGWCRPVPFPKPEATTGTPKMVLDASDRIWLVSKDASRLNAVAFALLGDVDEADVRPPNE